MPMNALSLFLRRSRLAPLTLACSLLVSGAAWSQTAPEPAAATALAPAGIDMVNTLSGIPAPTLGAKAWLTLDATSGQVIAAQHPQEAVEPASLTKLMSAYVIFEALETGRLQLDQKVRISEKAWKTEGSRMFVDPNTEVAVDDLLQ